MRSKGCGAASTIHSLIYKARDSGEEVPSFDLWDDAMEATPGSEFCHIGTDETSELARQFGSGN